MLRLPLRFAAGVLTFAPLFSHRSWRQAEVLLIGAILAPGRRTVASLLRISGLARERRFVNYHRVLNRAAWSPRAASHLYSTPPTVTEPFMSACAGSAFLSFFERVPVKSLV